MQTYKGVLPKERDILESLPGIGPYTARAVRSFAYGKQETIIDTNIRRVIARICYGKNPTALREKTLERAIVFVEPARQGEVWYQALMDFGAMICTGVAPKCAVCPLRDTCKAYSIIQKQGVRALKGRVVRHPQSRFHGSNRYWRGKIIEVLRDIPQRKSLSLKKLGSSIKEDFSVSDEAWLQEKFVQLEKDGLVQIKKDKRGCRVRLVA